MKPEEIEKTLKDWFGEAVAQQDATSWQVESRDFRLLVLLSEDSSWLRVLLPIAPANQVQPFLEKLLEANFDTTQETRYALHQNVLWGVFQHPCLTLNQSDFLTAIQRLLALHKNGLSEFFNELIETRIRQIIQVAKQQGQSLEMTLQTLERFYAEGFLGEMEGTAASYEQTLAAWRWQLERLWPEVEP